MEIPNRYLQKLLFALPFLFCGGVYAEDNTWVVNEKNLVAEIEKQSPDIQRLRQNLNGAKYGLYNIKENYQWQWVTSANTSDSSEKSIASFMPTFGPTYYFATGLQKNFQSGLSLQADVFTDQQSTTDKVIDRATRSGVYLGLSVDLWKNFLGRMSKAEVKDQKIHFEKQKIQTEINQRSIELELRKIYWSLVANNEQMRITSELLESSKRQLADGLKRNRQHIADGGEVARFRAQVESRKSTIESLKAQRDLYIQALKEQMPEMAEKKIELGSYDIEGKVKEVMICTMDMMARKKVPWDYTKADELLELVEKSYEQKKKMYNRYSDVDVQLESTMRYSGVDQGYGRSFKDFSENTENGYTVGLTISVPLGGTKSEAKKAKDQSNYYAFLAEKNSLLAQTRAQHSQIVSLVSMLRASLESIEKNTENLRISLKNSQRKFRQARIPLNDLVSEQDALLNSLLQEIDTKLRVVHIFLDYFKIYTEDPCTINKVGA